MLGKCSFFALISAVMFMMCLDEFWDTLNFEHCEIRTPPLPETPFDKALFSVERMSTAQSGCFTSRILFNSKYDRKGLPVNLGVIQLTALSHMSHESLQSFYSEYYEWIDSYTRKGGILLLKNFTKAMTDRDHLSSRIGNVDFQTDKLPPVFIPIPIHSHIMPHPIIIQCIQQTTTPRLGHTMFYNLPNALQALSQQDRDDIYRFLTEKYTIPFLTVPHDFISCEYHSCSERQVHVVRTMVNQTDISQGFGMIPHVWFRGGGYIIAMIHAATLGITSNFWRGFWGGVVLRPMSFIMTRTSTKINKPFERRLWDALWLNSVGIRLTPGDMVISNSWVNPHARLTSNEGKKLRTVEFFPCNSIGERTNCGRDFDFEDLEALATDRMDYTQGLSKSYMHSLFTQFDAFFKILPVSTFLY